MNGAIKVEAPLFLALASGSSILLTYMTISFITNYKISLPQVAVAAQVYCCLCQCLHAR